LNILIDGTAGGVGIEKVVSSIHVVLSAVGNSIFENVGSKVVVVCCIEHVARVETIKNLNTEDGSLLMSVAPQPAT